MQKPKKQAQTVNDVFFYSDATVPKQAEQALQHERQAAHAAELVDINDSLRCEIRLRQQAEERWRKQAARAEAVSRVASRINAQLDLDPLFKTICEESLSILNGFSFAWVGLYDENSDAIIPRASASTKKDNIADIPNLPRKTFNFLIKRFGAPLILTDRMNNQDAIKHVREMGFIRKLNIHSLVLQPLDVSAELIGYLAAASIDDPGLPDEDDIRTLQDLSVHARIAVSNAQMYRQVTESQERLRALSDRLMQVREEERRALAYELHDEFGQALTAFSLTLESASRGLQISEDRPSYGSTLQNAQNYETLENLRVQVGRLLQKIRDLSQDLRPGVLDDLGLFPALVDYCERFSRQTGVMVNLKQNGALRRFTPRIETTVFRLAQEALTNVARHARVSSADVLLWADEDLLMLKIQNQGVGVESLSALSLAGMQEQAGQCGGSLEIESMLGRGTIITLEIPLTER